VLRRFFFCSGARSGVAGASVSSGFSAKDFARHHQRLAGAALCQPQSDHVNVRVCPTKDNDVAWFYTVRACRLKSPLNSRTGAGSGIRREPRLVYHSLLSGRRTAVITMKTKDEPRAALRAPDETSSIAARLQAGRRGQVKPARPAGAASPARLRWLDEQHGVGVYADEKVE